MKVLIIRFSSIGDVTQSLSIPAAIYAKFPLAEIHFLTKEEFAPLMQHHPQIKKVWTITSAAGLKEIKNLTTILNAENFTHIYDAHNNTRSQLFMWWLKSPNKLTRSLERFKRFLLVYFKINLFEKPFSGQRDLIKPLINWGIPFSLPQAPQLFLSKDHINRAQALIEEFRIPIPFTVLAPSAAHSLKRWPIERWKELIKKNPQKHFVVLAGPKDFFTDILNEFKNVTNLSGKTKLEVSAALISDADSVISNDTGLLHFSEQLGKPTVALMGPAPFGFPSRSSTVILKTELPCWPCSKHGQGPCTNPKLQQCMTDIQVADVEKVYHQL